MSESPGPSLRRFLLSLRPSFGCARCRLARALLAVAAGFVLMALWRSGLRAPEPTFLLRDRQGRFLGEVGSAPDGEYGYWPLEALPPRVVAATLAVEDRRFRTHPGVDPLAVLRAVRQNMGNGRRVSGASTLAMQVARMQRPGTRGYARKALEALTALFVTARHGRDAVLAHYLRIVPYGNRIHGIGYAARRYLDKPVQDLSWAETAFLTAIPQAPARSNPFLPSGRWRAVRRGGEILDRLFQQGALTGEEHELAKQQIVTLAVPPAGERPREALHAVLRLEDLLQAPAARKALAATPVVRASLDLDVQAEVAWLAFRAVAAWEARGARNAAAIVVDRGTREVLAWVGSTDYFDEGRSGAIDYARVPRSPGSTLKPFVYALALEQGVITPATILDDLERGAGGITNADEAFLGPLLPRVALANSRNVPAADLLARAGLDRGYDLLRELGLHDGSEPARRYGLGLAIGGLPVTLEALVRAYTAFAADGRLGALVWYDGQPVAAPRRVFAEETARRIGLFLSDPQARLPTFARMGSLEYPFPVAVKTGTSSRFRDAWTVAYSTRYVVGVWLGDPAYQPMNRLTGYRSAAELAQEVLLFLHRDEAAGLHDLAFAPPRGFQPLRLCALTGARAGEACERVFVEWFRPSEEPVAECEAHLRLAIDTRTGLPANRATPRDHIEVRTVVDLPPRYAAWAETAGLPRPPKGPEAHAAALPGTAGGPARITITSPESGLRVLRDPETPPERATLALKAVVDPPPAQVVWYVDGAPLVVVDYPHAARWRLAPGEHVFEARPVSDPTARASVRVSVE